MSISTFMRIAPLVLAGSLFLIAQTSIAKDAACLHINTQPIRHVDMVKVRDTWLSWVNAERLRQRLAPYALDEHLNATAGNWSLYAVKRGSIDHKRSPQSPYYNYKGIEQWFGKLELTFGNVNRTTFSENIGWGVYKCRKRDCTQTLIDALHSTFDFYMAEKGKADAPHYNSMINPDFRMIGIGVAMSPSQGRYYVTVHYATTITSDPPALCRR